MNFLKFKNGLSNLISNNVFIKFIFNVKKKCCVVGLGYIGLPTSALLANSGFDVVGVDKNENIVDLVNKGEVHIKEPDLSKLVEKVTKQKKLIASLIPVLADIFIITVPTPIRNSSNKIPEPDISYVLKAAQSISKVIKQGDLIIIESTCPVGTTKKIYDLIKNQINFDVEKLYFAYCPERVIPGKILKELKNNNRVVGGLTQKASLMCKEFYSKFCEGEIFITSAEAAEMVKITENAYRDVNIAFSNEISLVCNKFNIDTLEVIKLANFHPRVNILNPGCGVGGHCIAVDPWFIASNAKDLSKLIQSARAVNNQKTIWVYEEIKKLRSKLIQKINREPNIACMGLTYKENVDDLRESPALKIAEKLINDGLNVILCEPNLKEFSTYKLFDVEETIEKADIIVFLVSHSEFKNLSIKEKVIFDVCGVIR